MTFVSADYRLLPPATGSDILEDIKDLFKFLVNDLQRLVNDAGVHTSTNFDTKSFIVVGTSAGGLCAYLAAIHADPKPKALVSLYGMGGDYLVGRFTIKCSLSIIIDFYGESNLNIFLLRKSRFLSGESCSILKNFENFYFRFHLNLNIRLILPWHTIPQPAPPQDTLRT